MKTIKYLLLILFALLLVPVFFGDRLARRFAEREITARTGLPVQIESLQVGLIKPILHLRNAVVGNPPGFPVPDALKVRELYVDYDRSTLLSRDIRLRELRLDVPLVVYVKPEEGPGNLERLGGAGASKKEEPGGSTDSTETSTTSHPTPKDEASEPRTKRNVQIDELRFKLGEVEIRQYRAGREPTLIRLPVDMERSISNVTNLEQTIQQLAAEVALYAGVGMLKDSFEKGKGKDGKDDPIGQIKSQFDAIKGLFK